MMKSKICDLLFQMISVQSESEMHTMQRRRKRESVKESVSLYLHVCFRVCAKKRILRVKVCLLCTSRPLYI